MSEPVMGAAPSGQHPAPEREVVLGDLLDRAGWPGTGALLVVLAAPAFLPIPLLPTGVVVGAVLAMLAVQILAGSPRPWLPSRVRRYRLRRASLANGIVRMLELLGRLGLVPRPRLPWAVQAGFARALIAGSLLVAAFVLVLPLPFGNQLPALAGAAFGLALLRRDGVAAIAGHCLTLLAAVWAGALIIAGGAVFGALIPGTGIETQPDR